MEFYICSVIVLFLSHLRSLRGYWRFNDLKQHQGLKGSADADKIVLLSCKILSLLGLCTTGLHGGSITLVKPADPQVLSQITDRIAALFLLPPEKVFSRMNTRTVNDDFDPAAFGDMFQRLDPKITAFWNAGDAFDFFL